MTAGLALAALLAALQAPGDSGAGSVFGVVRDSVGSPVAAVFVQVRGTALRGYTDNQGTYRLDAVPPGQHTLDVRRIGFKPASQSFAIEGGNAAEVDIVLQRAVPLELAGVVVTAAKRSQLLEEAVTSVAEVTPEQLDRRAVNTVDEAVDKAPGVQLLNGQVNIRGSSGYAQGLGSRVLLLVDGVPANQGDRGGINWDLLPVDAVERVEIVKGSGSALYGSSAMGGVVNLITEDPAPGLHGQARATFGVFGAPPHDIWRFRDFTGTQTGIDGTVSYGNDPWRWELRGGGRHSDGYREHNRSDHWQAALRGLWLTSPTARLDLSGAWASDQYQTALLWCTRTHCDDQGQEYQPFKVDTSGLGNHTRSDKGFFAVSFRSTPSATFAWRARGSFFHTHFIDFQRSNNDESFADRLGTELQGELHPTPDRIVTMGGELGLSYVNSNLFGDHSQGEYAAYAESESRWGAARVTLGARLDIIGVDGGAFEAVPSPRAGAVVPTGIGILRVSAGRGFRAASLAERYVSTVVQGLQVIPNPDLHPEIGWAVEVGDAIPFSGGEGRWAGYLDAALFWNEARDLIEPQIVTSGTQIQFRNVTSARMVGLDLAGTVQPPILRGGGGAVIASLSYTYLWSRDLTQDRPLAFRPRHLLTVSADYTRGPLSAGADYRYMSRMERVEIFEADPRVAASVLDVRAGLRWSRVDARLKVLNVLNYIYTLVPRTLAPPRTAALTLRYNY